MMSISEKVKTIDKKSSKQNKAQYDLYRETGKISSWLSGNDTKYEFLTGKEVLPEKYLLGNADTMKRL